MTYKSCRQLPGKLLLLLLLCAPAIAADPAIKDWLPETDYDQAIPTYTEILGYAPGEALTGHREMLYYLQTLAAASGRVNLETYGESYQGRQLVIAVISTPEHLAEVEQITGGLQVLMDPRLPGDRSRIIDTRPVVVYLAYSIHGDEHSNTEAALLTAYHLAADRSDQTREVLDNTVVVIDPLLNPDGRMRYISYYENTQALPANPDPNAVEHSPYPIGGRTNHYLFDLNRDWFVLTQQETRARVQQVQRWLPQVFGSYHEMGHRSSYYFAPPAEAVNKNFSPQVLKWLEIFGRENARAFDRQGWRYFTREIFDSFYPGYGDSWPMLNGAVAMTFEQASAEGRHIEKPDGHIVTLAEAIRHHFTTGVTTITTAARNRRELLRDFTDQFQAGLKLGMQGPIRRYILPLGPDDRNNLDLSALLIALGIEVQEAEESFAVKKVSTHLGQRAGRMRFPTGTLIVPLEQPRHALLKAIFEPESELDRTFIEEELRRHEERLPDRIYDVTAWSLPLAYDATVYTTAEVSRVRTRPFDPQKGWAGSNTPLSKEESIYAYLIPYRSHYALQTLVHLWQEGVQVHMSRESFTQAGVIYPRGTLVVFPADNPLELPALMRTVIETYPVELVSTSTGWTEEGIDLGSDNVVFIKQPRVLALYPQPPLSAYSYGWLAWLLEQEYRLPFTAIWPHRLEDVQLNDYDVLILPHASDSYGDVLDDQVMGKVKAWIQGGGTLIGLKSGAAFLTGEELDLTSVLPADDVRPEEQTREKIKQRRENEQEVPHAHRPQSIPGAIFEVQLNRHHYLSYGYDEDTYVHVQSDYIFIPSEDGVNVAVFPEGGGKVSGFAWDGADSQLSEKVFLVDEHVGEGHVILFADDPNFRGYWRGMSKLFMNAVMLSPSLRR
ncbi:MAG: hypothetical protein JSU77_03270 [Fidelibacterota bacterium]|nr:MAG: hypothetical protein JSU77_03270 [Candidatus Neomarinimicrobiota bacterium]